MNRQKNRSFEFSTNDSNDSDGFSFVYERKGTGHKRSENKESAIFNQFRNSKFGRNFTKNSSLTDQKNEGKQINFATYRVI